MARSKSKRNKKTSEVKYDFNNAFGKTMERLRYLCESINCDVFSKLSANDKKSCYYSICIANHIQKDPGAVVNRQLYYIFNKLINSSIRKRWSNLVEDYSNKISVFDLMILNGLVHYVDTRDDESKHKELFPYKDVLIKKFGGTKFILEQLCQLLWHMMEVNNIPGLPMYYFRICFDSLLDLPHSRMKAWDLRVNSVDTQKGFVNMNGHIRPIFRLSWPLLTGKESFSADIDTSKLGHYYKGKRNKLPVYIQSHASERLFERCEPIPAIWCTQSYFHSFYSRMEVEVYDGRILFSYSNYKMKLGYFLADVIDEKIIIKTFLLITHEHTPEGGKFQELTGFSKHDVNYWNIDKLTTFINNDMFPDNPLYPYFKEAGLLHLFEMNEETFKGAHVKFSHAITQWDKISNYIERREKNDEVYEELDDLYLG